MIRALRRTSLLVFLVAVHLGTILMLAPTRPALADLEDGRVAFKRGDFSAALSEWEPLAEAGDPYAQFYLGLMYYDGIGISQNLLEAEKWFRMAGDQGHAPAQISLGVMYGEGQGVRADLVHAFMWFTLAKSRLPFGENRERVLKNLNIIAAIMTPEQITEASILADEWHPKIQGSSMLKAQEKGSQQEKSAQTTAPKTGPRDVAAKTSVAIQPEPASSSFFVQSASLKTMDLAHKERSRQQHAYPDLLGDLRLAIREANLSSLGKVFRLQIGPLQNRSIAEDLCQELKAKEQGCFVLNR